MKIVDANVLLYATDETTTHHGDARRWIEQALVGTESVGVAPCDVGTRQYARRMTGQVSEVSTAAPAGPLAGLVTSYSGSRVEGLPPGRHLGLPSPQLGLVIALGDPVRIAAMPDRARAPGAFRAVAYGLQTRPAVIAHDGSSYTVSVHLTPAGARALLGVPAAALAGAVVSLDDPLGPVADELATRAAAAPDWSSRFAVVTELLSGRAGTPPPVDPALGQAWRRLVASGGTATVRALAAETGYSRQHLTRRFTAEYGQTPKQVARLVRFARSHRMLRTLGQRRHRQPTAPVPLAEVAARCGYYDQAHLAREWNSLAGCPPSAWLAAEQLPFVQDRAAQPEAASVP